MKAKPMPMFPDVGSISVVFPGVINPFFSASSNIEIAGLHHSTPKKDTKISLIPEANITRMNYINHGFMLFMYRHLYRHQMVLLLSHDCANL